MRDSFIRTGMLLAVAVSLAAPAQAANKEQQQLMADMRILQEQSQQLLNRLGELSETLKSVNARIDEQVSTSRKAAADQRLVTDSLSNDVRVVRERLDDNNVRIGSLTQEVEALRQSMQMLGARALSADADRTASSSGPSAPVSAPPVVVGMSPQKLWDGAYSDYTSGQWDLAIQGFDMYIKSFPKSDMADNAQVNVGNAYLNDGKPDKAIEAYDKAIRTYLTGDAIPEAWYKKGLALQSLKNLTQARLAWEYAVKNFPDSEGGRMSKLRLEQLRKP